MTPQREKRIADVLARRFSDLHVVLENILDPHNLGAILRSCDAVGIGEVHLLYTQGKQPRMRELRTKAAASAAKWLKIQRWDSVDACVQALREKQLKLLVTALSEVGKPQWEFDLTRPSAIIIGNEHAGVSPGLLAYADGIITIPMRGMVQSLNVSVATAVVLEEALRQRLTL